MAIEQVQAPFSHCTTSDFVGTMRELVDALEALVAAGDAIRERQQRQEAKYRRNAARAVPVV